MRSRQTDWRAERAALGRTIFRAEVLRGLSVAAMAVSALSIGALPALANTRPPSGTSIVALKTTVGHLTGTYAWTVTKAADPTSQVVAVGDSGVVRWTITTTKSGSQSLGASFTGHV